MNENSHLQNLLNKFILNQCNPQEIEEVVSYFQNNRQTSEFPSVEDIIQLLGEMPKMDEAAANIIFSNIVGSEKQPKVITLPPRRNYTRYIAIAASLLILLSVGISYNLGLFDAKNELVLTGNEITLQLENGEIQVISEANSAVLRDENGAIIANQNHNKIVYDTTTAADKLVYSTITIPYGKRFQLQLSDGTLVHLNSGTTLKYPVKFIAGQNRQVFLDGEAYFDVAKDKKHPFVVNADELNVRVLGTHFNVSSYPEDEMNDVVLVEGSVGLYTSNEPFDATKSTILKPGFKGSFAKQSKKIATKAVVTDFYTSWIDGRLTFKNMTFKNIAKKLERHYDITIVNMDDKLANEKFNASFKNESIQKVLSYFGEIHAFDYTVKDDKITIK